MKKIIVLFLVIAVLVSVIPIGSYAEESVNLALGATTWGSSVYGSETYSFDKAVDGKVNTFWASIDTNAYDHPDSKGALDGKQYIVVDLGMPAEISRVVVRSRRDFDVPKSRMDWTVTAATDKEFKNEFLIGAKPTAGAAFSDLDVTLPEDRKIVARYIRLITPINHTAVSEIEVYGVPQEARDTYDDLTDSIYSDAHKLNKYLDLIQPIDAATFGTDNFVKNDDAVKTVLNTFYPNGEIAPEESFIKEAINLRLVDSFESLDESGYMKKQTFVNILLCGLGYGEYINARAGVSGSKNVAALAFAKKLKIINNTKDFEKYMTRGEMLLMLSKALVAQMYIPDRIIVETDNEVYTEYEEGENVLYEVYGLYYKAGTITGNGVSTLVAPIDEKNDYIEVNNVGYTDTTGSLFYRLGENIKFLADKDGNIVNAWVDGESGTKVTIDSEDIDSISRKELKAYNEKDKLVRYGLESAFVIKNGVAYGGDIYSDVNNIKPVCGYVEILDADDDGVYEIIKIFAPEIIVIDSFKKTNGTSGIDFSFARKGDTTVEVKDYKLSRAIQEGVMLDDVSAIKSAPLMLAYVSDDNNYFEISAVGNAETAAISRINKDIFVVGGKEHRVSKYWKNNAQYFEPELGCEYSFVYDSKDRVVWMEKSKAQTTIAVILNIVPSKNSIEKSKIKLYTQDNETKIYEFASKVTVDGIRMSDSEFANTLTTSKINEYIKKPCKFKLNANGEINFINTPFEGSGEDNTDMKEKALCQADGLGKTVRSGETLFAESSTTYLGSVKLDTPIYVIPCYTATGKPCGDEYGGNYGIVKFSSLGTVIDTPLYGYGMDEYGCPEFLVRIAWMSDIAATTPYTSVKFPTRILVSEICTVLDGEGNPVCQITGYKFDDGSKVAYNLHSGITKMIGNEGKVRTEHPEWIVEGRIYSDYVTESEVEPYFVPITELKPGDLISVELGYNNAIEGINRLVDIENIKTQNYFDYCYEYSSTDTYGYSGTHVVKRVFDKMSIQNATIGFEYNNEPFTVMMSSPTSVFVCEKNDRGDTVKKITKNEEIKNYAEKGDAAITLVKYGIVRGLIIYK